jgi:hypothetical protein
MAARAREPAPFVPLHKMINVTDTIDYEIVRASRTPGPGQYYRDDILDSIPGGTLPKAKAKTAVDWECYRAAQIPAPGDYYVDDTSASIPGGALAKGNSKSGTDWEQYRASQLPGPDYDVDRTWRYLDGTNGRAGFTMSSRSGPAKLPAPYASMAIPSTTEIRGAPHPTSHAQALTPWREDDWKQRKREAAIALGKVASRAQAGDGSGGAHGELNDSYASSLTPWRDPPSAAELEARKRRPRTGGGGRAARAPGGGAPGAAEGSDGGGGGGGGGVPRPQSAPPTAGGAGGDDEAAARGEAAQCPWRDREAWVQAAKEVVRIRKDFDRKHQAKREVMKQRPPFGGGGSGASRRKPVDKVGEQFAARAHRQQQQASAKAGRRPPERRPPSAASASSSRGARQRPTLRARFTPSSTIPGVTRLADPRSVGGSEGGFSQLGGGGGGGWRSELRERVERLASMAMAPGDYDGPVETSIMLVQSEPSVPTTQRRRRRRQQPRKLRPRQQPQPLAFMAGAPIAAG